MKNKKVQICIVIILGIIIAFSGTCMASSIKYYLDGGLEKLTTENVELGYYLDGGIEYISINNASGSVVIEEYLDCTIKSITTPSGSITCNLSGSIDKVNGDWEAICKEVENALESANSEIVSYINSINIQVPGAANPSESASVITESLNEIIDYLNSNSTYNSTNNSSNSNTVINQNGASINLSNNDNTSGAIIGGNTNSSNNGNLSVNSNGINFNSSNTGVSVNSNGVNMQISGSSSVSVDEEEINISGSNSLSTETSSNTSMLKYIIIGIVCYVVFLIIVLIIKIIQGENANKKLIKVLIAVSTLIFVVYIALVVFFNLSTKHTNNDIKTPIANNGGTVNLNNGSGSNGGTSVSVENGKVDINNNSVSKVNNNKFEFRITGKFQENKTIDTEVAGNILTISYNGKNIWQIDEFVLYQSEKNAAILGGTFGINAFNYVKTKNAEILFDGQYNILALKTDECIFSVNPNSVDEILFFEGSVGAAIQTINQEFENNEIADSRGNIITIHITEDYLKKIEDFKKSL